MTTALITGGLGFIGSYIAKDLLDSNVVDKVVCLDSFASYVDVTDSNYQDYRHQRFDGYEEKIIVERGDAKFYGVTFNVINEYRPKLIFHLASLPLAKIDNLNVQEAFESSVTATANIIEICSNIENYNLERFIYTSSSMVYGNFQEEMVTEDTPCKPIEVYGTAKLAGEITTKGLCGFHDIPWTVIRPSAVFGPTDMNRRVSQIFIEKALNAEKIEIHGEKEKLDFTYVKDLAKGFVLAATNQKAANEIFNITNGNAHTLLEFVNVLQRILPNVEYELKERDSLRPRRGTLDNSKANKILNFYPEYTLEEGIKEYSDFVIKNKNQIE
jgi:UDP-glucose 4-epimerase